MHPAPKPVLRPANPRFGSGPMRENVPAGASTRWRMHFSAAAIARRRGRARLDAVIRQSRALLGMPQDWRLGIVPGSDTGAVEMVLWSLLGPRPVDVLAFESFSATWANDIVAQLALPDARVLEAAYGALPPLDRVDWSRDVVFAWNGTTSGVCFPGADAIPAAHEGLAICDATSAAFAMKLPWDRLDVVTWSWQKVLGGEAAHGMLALSPRAVARLEGAPPPRPLPKLFRLTSPEISGSGHHLIEGIFAGDTINTPSMLCTEDALDGLRWAGRIGGLEALIARSTANLAAIAAWVERSDWAGFLAEDPAQRSSTSICLRVVAPWFTALPAAEQSRAAKHLSQLVEREQAGYDIASYRDAPPGLRIWGGATVETSDIDALLPWLDWAEAETRALFAGKTAPV
nr:phosphoserine transaminase [uncultured Lichenicoccus sp.]